MSICLCCESALELYRSSGRLLPDVLARPRTAKLEECRVHPVGDIEDELLRLGVRARPVHLLVGDAAHSWPAEGIGRHVHAGPLPGRSLVKIRKGVLATGPELLFCDLASPRSLDVIEAARIGFELCGTYLLDESWDGLCQTDAPMTSVRSIARFIESRGPFPGVRDVRAALKLVQERSNSPRETVAIMLLTLPRRLGGMGFPLGEANCRMATSLGERFVDYGWRKLGVGIEYQGKEFHSIEQVEREDRRRNAIAACGVTVFNVWNDDLVQEQLFEQLVVALARAMGLRLRPYDEVFLARRSVLRAMLLPTVRALR